MKHERRKSRLRERIYGAIASSKAHPSAQDVYDGLRKEIPRLSLGSVYRNIAILLEEGRIRSGDFGLSSARYDADTSSHCHFVCERCGAVLDFDMPAADGIDAAARKLSSHRIHGHAIRFFGVCSRCARAEGAVPKVNRHQ